MKGKEKEKEKEYNQLCCVIIPSFKKKIYSTTKFQL